LVVEELREGLAVEILQLPDHGVVHPGLPLNGGHMLLGSACPAFPAPWSRGSPACAWCLHPPRRR
jgi:hypothetical protein